MKKKIFICIGIIITILFISFFGCLISIKKTPATVEQYIKVMNKYNIDVIDQSNQIPDSLRQFIFKQAYSDSDRLHTSFLVFDSNSNAAITLEENYKKIIADNSTVSKKKLKNGLVVESSKLNKKIIKSISISNNHYCYKTFHLNGGYYAFIRVENTLLMFIAHEENKNNVDLIVKELNYIGNECIILFTLYYVASFLSLILMCFCFANIFKNHNIRPWFVLVPILNIYYLCKIADKKGWKMFLFLIPLFNFLYHFILMYKLAKRYTDSKLICFGIGFLPLIFLPVIAFDKPKGETPQKNIYEEILKEEGIV